MKLLKAIKILKQGIVEADDDLIEEGFYLLTGERVLFPNEESSIDVDIEDVRGLSNYPQSKTENEDFTMKREEGAIKEKRVFINNFNPNMSVDEEAGSELLNDNIKPVPRTRAEHKMISIFCHDCKKTIETNPKYLTNKKGEPYHCDLIKCGQSCPNFK